MLSIHAIGRHIGIMPSLAGSSDMVVAGAHAMLGVCSGLGDREPDWFRRGSSCEHVRALRERAVSKISAAFCASLSICCCAASCTHAGMVGIMEEPCSSCRQAGSLVPCADAVDL